MEKKISQLVESGKVVEKKGVVIVIDKRIQVSNSTVTGSQFNTGNNVKQSISQANGITAEALEVFLSEIKKMPEGQEKNDALSDFQNLQEAVEKNNWERAKGIFKLFSETLRTSAAGVTVAKVIGLLPPLP
ncbi:hypothetical protein [Brevibacillus agri]|uniref:hypothetical protein n=1 Tax=Brevibacillus agri TaxID=51101 RepID=UPI00286800BC|nr:hypothetical protein [Brevibacillus agri]